jgi:protoporphyrinogen/coproporphyrinogen III oxidase
MLDARSPVANSRSQGPHVVIVGAGITGLAAAYACATDPRAHALNVRCTLVERDTRLGGKLYTEQVDGCLLEHGADSFLASKPAAATLCRALGLAGDLIGTTPGRAVYVVYRGRLHRFPEGMGLGIPTRLGPIARTGLLSAMEKVRVLGDLVLPRGGVSVDVSADESVGAFIRRRLGEGVLKRLAGPILGGIYAGDPDALSLRATFPQLLEWERRYRSLIIASARQNAARRAAGAPSPIFLSLRGGLGTLVDALQRSLAEHTIMTGRGVRRIQRRPADARIGAATGDTRAFVMELDDGATVDADAVVVTTPAHAAATQLADLAPAIAGHLRRIPYVSTATVSLGYKREDVHHDLAGHGFVVAEGEPMTITACTWSSSKWPHRAPAGTVLLRCYLGAIGRDGIVSEDDAVLTERATRDLRALLGIEAAPTLVRIVRWVHALPQYLVGHLDLLGRIDQELLALPTVALAGAAYGGVGIPDCITQGTAAAARVLDALAAPAVLA